MRKNSHQSACSIYCTKETLIIIYFGGDNMLPITRLLLTNKNRPKIKLKKLKGIVIHWTANENAGANALANRNYFNNTSRGASAHYIVDDRSIIQCIPDDEVAYHVGAKKYRSDGLKISESPHGPNYFLIGIEMCVNKDGVWNKTYQNTIDLVVYLLKKYSLSVDDLYRHYDITGKDCPRMMIDEREWNNFKNDVKLSLGIVKIKPNKPEGKAENDNENPKNQPMSEIPALKRILKLTNPLMEGEDVKMLQNKLKNQGYEVGNVDGFFGEQTLSAVKKFQQDNKLAIDGIVGPNTWKTLFNSNEKQSDVKGISTTVVPELKRNLKLSEPLISGEDVKALQKRLGKLGYEIGVVDGIFGKMTQNAVKKFQQDKKLTVDGIVGPSTWKALFS